MELLFLPATAFLVVEYILIIVLCSSTSSSCRVRAVFDERAARSKSGITQTEQAQKDTVKPGSTMTQLSNTRQEKRKITTTALARRHRTHIIADAHARCRALMLTQITAAPPAFPSNPQRQRTNGDTKEGEDRHYADGNGTACDGRSGQQAGESDDACDRR